MENKVNLKKKLIILYVLNILKSYSSGENPINQSTICNYLRDIGLICDRKTVGRNIKFLQKIGYPIIKTSKGYYMDNKIFSIKEINYIINAIEKAEDSSEINKSELKDKLQKQLNGLKR